MITKYGKIPQNTTQYHKMTTKCNKLTTKWHKTPQTTTKYYQIRQHDHNIGTKYGKTQRNTTMTTNDHNHKTPQNTIYSASGNTIVPIIKKFPWNQKKNTIKFILSRSCFTNQLSLISKTISYREKFPPIKKIPPIKKFSNQIPAISKKYKGKIKKRENSPPIKNKFPNQKNLQSNSLYIKNNCSDFPFQFFSQWCLDTKNSRYIKKNRNCISERTVMTTKL